MVGKQVVAEIKCSPERWGKLDRKALFDYVRDVGEIMRDDPENFKGLVTVYDSGKQRPIKLIDNGLCLVCKLDLTTECTPVPDEEYQSWCAAPLYEVAKA